MDNEILKYKKTYKIFVILMLIGLIDSVLVPSLFKSMGKEDLGDFGLIPIFFTLVAGKTGGTIALWFTLLWFVWGLIAVIANRKAKNLEKKQKEIAQITIK